MCPFTSEPEDLHSRKHGICQGSSVFHVRVDGKEEKTAIT